GGTVAGDSIAGPRSYRPREIPDVGGMDSLFPSKHAGGSSLAAVLDGRIRHAVSPGRKPGPVRTGLPEIPGAGRRPWYLSVLVRSDRFHHIRARKQTETGSLDCGCEGLHW